MEKKIDILDFILFILKWKYFFIINVGVITLIAIITSLLLPKYYISTGTILPKEEHSSSILQKAISALPVGNILDNLGSSNNYISNDNITTKFITIMNSRKIKLKMIEKFNLIEDYKFDKSNKYYIEDVLEEVTENIYLSEGDGGALIIGAGHEKPEKAQKMAKHLINQLDTIYRELRTKKLKNNLEFIKKRKNVYENELEKLENEYKSFQEKYNIIDVNSQANATVKAARNIESEYLIVQKKIDLIKNLYGENSLRLNELKKELKALKIQRNRLTNNRYSEFLLPLKKTPSYMLTFARLKRDLKIKETLYSFILQEYETSKLELKRQTPVLQKLDPPNLPEKRKKPKRKKLVIIVFFIAVFESLIIIKILEYFKSLERINSEASKKLHVIKKEVLGLIPFQKNTN